MNQYSNKSKKFRKNLDNEVRQKLCEAAIIRVRTLRESLDEAEEKLLKIIRKRKQFVKIWMLKPNRKYVKQVRKD